MRLGAKEGVGFDISDAAIAEAEELAEIARANALEIDETYNSYFDFIYISQGSLQWFPNLNDYFRVISRLLKKDGKIIIFEIHPFKYFFENGFHFQEQNFDKLTSYFKPRDWIISEMLNTNQMNAFGSCIKCPRL